MIFLLGWPLEWTEITIIFLPLFLPLLKTYDIDPLFFGIMTALNQQTSFLSPPVAMSAFYLKGVAPRTSPSTRSSGHVPVPGDSGGRDGRTVLLADLPRLAAAGDLRLEHPQGGDIAPSACRPRPAATSPAAARYPYVGSSTAVSSVASMCTTLLGARARKPPRDLE